MVDFKMWLVGISALLWLTTASAQTIRAECVKMRDKIGCTCALNNGGGLKADGTATGAWYSAPGHRGRPRNQAFTDCVAHWRKG